MFKVLVTRKIMQPAIDLLNKYCNVEINPYDRPMTRTELLEAIKDKDVLK